MISVIPFNVREHITCSYDFVLLRGHPCALLTLFIWSQNLLDSSTGGQLLFWASMTYIQGPFPVTACGSQPLRQPLVIPASWHWSPVQSSSRWTALTNAPNRILQKWQNVTSKMKSSKSLPSPSSSLGLLPLGTTSCPGMRTPEKPYGEVSAVKNWVLLPKATGVRHFGSGFAIASQAFGWLEPRPTFYLQLHERPWARNIQLCCSQVPGPQKLCKIIHSDCFRQLCLGVIYYTVLTSRRNLWVFKDSCSQSSILMKYLFF